MAVTLTQRINQAIAMMFGGGLPLSNRNLFVDGNKDVWTTSAATSLSTLGQYTPQALLAGRAGTGGVCTYQQGQWNAAPGNASGYGLSKPKLYYGAFAQTTGSSGSYAALTAPGVWMPVEDVGALENQSFTYSVWLWAAAPITVQNVFWTQNFGTGGSPSANVSGQIAVNWAVTTTPKRFSVRVDIPSITGKTIGTTTNGYTQIGVQYPPSSTFTINDDQWQLERCSPQASGDLNGAGGSPTAFEYRGQQPELARVQRLYATMGAQLNTYGTAGLGIAYNQAWPTYMRIAPAISFNGGSYSNASGISAVNPTNQYARIQAVATATGQAAFNDWVMTLDARL